MIHHHSRRRFLRVTSAAVLAGAVAGCTGDDDPDVDYEMEDDVPEEIDEFLSAAQGYGGEIADGTGEDEVTVVVGAGDGGLAYDPAALRVDAGTTVVFEWTGRGGSHNVVSTEESATEFESELKSESGETFEWTFDDAGHQFYVCTPHEQQGMYGAIDVVD